MKIAFLSTFYPYRGGIAQFNAALYQSLALDYSVKAFNFSVQYPSLLFPGKTQYVEENDLAEKIDSERVLNSINPLTYRKTVNAIKRYDPDILIVGYWMPFMAPSLGYVAKKLKKSCQVVAIVHNATPHESKKTDKVLNNYFFNRIDRFIALSSAVKTDILKDYPEAEVKVLLHPVYNHFGNCINQKEALIKMGLPEKNKYLLFFGLIRDYKGLDILLKALTILDKSYHLVIAGEVYGDYSKYQKIIDENHLSERIHFFNYYIPDEDVKLFFSLADCCVLPYRSATQSGIIAIAKHFNLPVVASNVGGLNEFITNKENGVLINTPSPENFAKVIDKIFREKDINHYRTKLKDEKNNNTWKNFAQQLIEFTLG